MAGKLLGERVLKGKKISKLSINTLNFDEFPLFIDTIACTDLGDRFRAEVFNGERFTKMRPKHMDSLFPEEGSFFHRTVLKDLLEDIQAETQAPENVVEAAAAVQPTLQPALLPALPPAQDGSITTTSVHFDIFRNDTLDRARAQNTKIQAKDYRELYRETVAYMRSDLRTTKPGSTSQRAKKEPTRQELDEAAVALKNFYTTLPDLKTIQFKLAKRLENSVGKEKRIAMAEIVAANAAAEEGDDSVTAPTSQEDDLRMIGCSTTIRAKQEIEDHTEVTASAMMLGIGAKPKTAAAFGSQQAMDMDTRSVVMQPSILQIIPAPPQVSASAKNEESPQIPGGSSDIVQMDDDEDEGQHPEKKGFDYTPYFEKFKTQLDELMNAKIIKWDMVDILMAKTQVQRREFVYECGGSIAERVVDILYEYPAFMDPNSVIKEAGRIVCGTFNVPVDFIPKKTRMMAAILPKIYLYGSIKMKVDMKLKRMSDDLQVVGVLNYLQDIFPMGRKTYSKIYSEQQGSRPTLNSMISQKKDPGMIKCGDKLVFAVGCKQIGTLDYPGDDFRAWGHALVAYLAIYYAFKLGYPRGLQVGLMVLQALVYESVWALDKEDVEKSGFLKHWQGYEAFIDGKITSKDDVKKD